MERNNKTAVLHLEKVMETEESEEKIACSRDIPSARKKTTIQYLEEKDDVYTLRDVGLPGRVFTIDIAKNLLEDGAERTQEEWIPYSQDENNAFRVVSADVYHQIFTLLHDWRNEEQYCELADKIRGFLNKVLQKGVCTLSQVHYNHLDINQGKDTVINDVGMLDERKVLEYIVGPHEYPLEVQQRASRPEALHEDRLRAKQSARVYKAILGSGDLRYIDEVYRWITGKSTYLWRSPARPEYHKVRAIGLWNGSDRFFINASEHLDGKSKGLGIRITQK